MKWARIGVSLSPERSSFGPLLYSGDLSAGLRRAAELGYSLVELSLRDATLLRADPLLEQLEGLQLRVAAIATGQAYYSDGYSLYHADASGRAHAVERIRAHVELAQRLGAAVILGGIRGRIDPADGKERARRERQGEEAVASCVGYAEAHGVTLLLEPINRYETDVINTVAQALELVDRIGNPCLKVLPDTFHMNIEEASIEDSIRSCGPRLGYIHMADSNRWAPGFGHLDFAAVAAALEEAGYSGPWGVEVLPRPNDEEAARQAIRHLAAIAGDRKSSHPA